MGRRKWICRSSWRGRQITYERVDEVYRLSHIYEHGRLRHDLRPRGHKCRELRCFRRYRGAFENGLVHVSQLAESFVAEMPAGIVLACPVNHKRRPSPPRPLDRL